MPLTILSDADVREVLNTITKQDVLDIHRALAEALHQYSTVTNTEESGCAAANQPSRISVKSKKGGTTLFMPASSNNAFGVKIVTLAESSKKASSTTELPDVSSVSLSETSSEVISKNSSPRSSSPSTAMSRTSSFQTRSGSPSTTASKVSSNTSESQKSVKSGIAQSNEAKGSGPENSAGPIALSATSPRGSITLLDDTGSPRALVNASTLTAFRTALVSTMLLKFRASVHEITVFGAGLQAFWHLFVAILLRGNEIHHVNIVNRDFDRAQHMMRSLIESPNDAVSTAVNGPKWRSSILTPTYVEYARLLREHVRSADVIFCTTPATSPLFPAAFLTATEGRRKGRYVAAIGSYKPHMQELHEDILRQAVKGPAEEQQRHGVHMHQKHAPEGGAIIVDSIEGAMREAGEIINAGIDSHSIVEIGELIMLKKSHTAEYEEKERRQQKSPTEAKHRHGPGNIFHQHHHKEQEEKQRRQRQREIDGGLMDWLERGNVIYKGVGIGLMDVVVGMEIVRLAEQRSIGTFVQDF